MDITNALSLKGKVALITGGSRGIGRAIALTFADAGADVVVCARKLPDLEEVGKELKARGGKSLALVSHVAKREDSVNLVERIKSEMGKLDILVNNAGTNPYYGPLMDAEEWAWDTTLNVNLKGAFLLSQLAARTMREHGGGCIINISSVAGLRPSPISIYSVTKAALLMLTQVMAKEWGQYNIRVNAIAPGNTKTRFSEVLLQGQQGEEARKKIALGRFGLPEDIAGAALYLASDIATYVTGETLVVDGGEFVGAASTYGGKE